jgi:hypothetical protein
MRAEEGEGNMAGAPPVVEGGQDYPLTFSVDYPDRDLNRRSSGSSP